MDMRRYPAAVSPGSLLQLRIFSIYLMAVKCAAVTSQANTRPNTAATNSCPANVDSAVETSNGPSQSQFYRTKICPFHLKHQLRNPRYTGLFASNVGCPEGTCAAGANDCRFAHSMRELRPLPDLTRTKLCPSFQRQVECTLADCPFAHSPHDLRTSSSVFYKVSLCNFYKANKCWNGANCRFAHGNQELRLNTELMKAHAAAKRDTGGGTSPVGSYGSNQADYARALTRGTSATPGCTWALGRTPTNGPLRESEISAGKEEAHNIHHPAFRRGLESITTTIDVDLRYGSLTSLSQISEAEQLASNDSVFTQAQLAPSLGGLDDAAEALLRLLELDQ